MIKDMYILSILLFLLEISQLLSKLNFEQAMTPNTPYTLRQTCNKLWYENIDVAHRYCPDSSFFTPRVTFSTPNVVGKFTYLPVWKDLTSHEQINTFLKTALDRANLDLGNKSPLVPAKWKIQPDKITIRVLPPGPVSYKFFTERKAHSGNHMATQKKSIVIATLEANRDMLLFLEHIGEGQNEEAKKIRMLISALEKDLQ